MYITNELRNVFTPASQGQHLNSKNSSLMECRSSRTITWVTLLIRNQRYHYRPADVRD
jgi:hypothetical protein